MKTIPLLAASTLVGLLLAGCTNADGRFRPIDPLGRMIFDALDPAPRQYNNNGNDSYYAQPQYQNGRQQNAVWVEGAYGRDANGRRVWIPAHYEGGGYR